MTIQPRTRVPPIAKEMQATFRIFENVQDTGEEDWDALPSFLCFLQREMFKIMNHQHIYKNGYLLVLIFLLTCTVGWGANENCKSDAESLSLLAAFSSCMASLFMTLLFISSSGDTNEYADSVVSPMKAGGCCTISWDKKTIQEIIHLSSSTKKICRRRTITRDRPAI